MTQCRMASAGGPRRTTRSDDGNGGVPHSTVRSDHGNAIVEFALWLPLVLLALCACLQLTVAIYDDRAAQDAAQVGLRARQSGAEPEHAARAALAGRAGDAEVTVDTGSVRVTLPVRQFLPWLPGALRSVSATATVPSEERP